jgi:anti-sigma regulatory factor (Ser/Thr protein kinase)
MIDHTRTRAGLLAEIEATEPASVPLSQITDLRVATSDARVCLKDHAQGELFPPLKLALSERFAWLPREQLIRDLLFPLKSALGNASKHGNGSDPAKVISVELVLTQKGAFLAVTDEGAGFDVAHTFRCFQDQQGYFVNQGAGFRSLHRAKSTVSYENGGRTLLLCFRAAPDPDLTSPASAEGTFSSEVERGAPVHGPISGEDRALPKILDADWIQTCLSAEVPEFSNTGVRIESCRVYASGGRASDHCGNRYVLRVSRQDGGLSEKRTLTGRFHATEVAAAADLEAATLLFGAEISKSVLIARPVARPAREPRLVLYEFDPWMSLWEYLVWRRSRKALRHCTEGIARALARLHGSQIQFHGGEPDPEAEGLAAMVGRAEATLQALPSSSEFAQPFRRLVQLMQEQTANRCPPTPAPILGAFGWDRIHYGVDSRFYLHGFETSRQGDPGLDLGGFAADLLCFTLTNHDEELFRTCHDAFLTNYNSKATRPMDEANLDFYIALGLIERLRRVEPRTWPGRGPLLAAMAVLLRPRGQLVAS